MRFLFTDLNKSMRFSYTCFTITTYNYYVVIVAHHNDINTIKMFAYQSFSP